MIGELSALPDAWAVYPFGEALHYTDRRTSVASETVAADVSRRLAAAGWRDVRVDPIAAGIEDAFIALMTEPAAR